MPPAFFVVGEYYRRVFFALLQLSLLFVVTISFCPDIIIQIKKLLYETHILVELRDKMSRPLYEEEYRRMC